jgi:hypothetical protein
MGAVVAHACIELGYAAQGLMELPAMSSIVASTRLLG